MKFLDKTVLTEKIVEALSSVLPVTGIVLLLLITIAPVSAAMLLSFLIGFLPDISRLLASEIRKNDIKKGGGITDKPCSLGPVGFPYVLLSVADKSGFPLKHAASGFPECDRIAV